MRTLLVALAALLAGCGPQMAQFDRGGLALLYADMKEAYGAIRADLVRACATPSAKLDKAPCDRLKAGDAQLAVADALVREAIKNPKAEVDFEKLGTFLRAAMKAGAASQTGGLSGLMLQ